MKILALDFSSPQRSVAIVSPTPALPPSTLDPRHATLVSEVVETGSRSTRALGMIEAALRQAQVEREQIECLAIGLGPGSYTGIRVAIAVAQGWQLTSRPSGVKLLGLSSADCLAAEAQAEGLAGRVAVVIDAQRDEFCLAGYELSAAGWREAQPLRLATLAEVQERAKAGDILVGPEVTTWFPQGRVVFPRAATLGQLALGRRDFIAGEKLEPIYLREIKFVKAPPPRILPL